jgi:trans-aconitate 2-methyltransferase
MPQWNPEQYLKFGSERTQPVRDLISRIALESPRRIVDLGCGPGNSTEELAQRWPDSLIQGVDNSIEMIERAGRAYPNGDWRVGDAASWKPEEPVDLVFSNAMLHWVPDHEQLCPRLLEQAEPGGALAVQAPAHYDSPLHREIVDVSRHPSWADRMEKPRKALTNHAPGFYYDLLAPMASRVDVWETTYYHVLAGPGAVLEWFRGTGLRPFLEALADDEERGRFEAMLGERYEKTYARRPNGRVLFPFRRLFFVAYR